MRYKSLNKLRCRAFKLFVFSIKKMKIRVYKKFHKYFGVIKNVLSLLNIKFMG